MSIDIHALCLSPNPKTLHNHCFRFLLSVIVIQKKRKLNFSWWTTSGNPEWEKYAHLINYNYNKVLPNTRSLAGLFKKPPIVSTSPPPSLPEVTCGFLIQLMFCIKVCLRHQSVTTLLCGATPPRKNPGSAPELVWGVVWGYGIVLDLPTSRAQIFSGARSASCRSFMFSVTAGNEKRRTLRKSRCCIWVAFKLVNSQEQWYANIF